MQPEAVSLYKKPGYNEIECYGRHATEPDSVCFEKLLIAEIKVSKIN